MHNNLKHIKREIASQAYFFLLLLPSENVPADVGLIWESHELQKILYTKKLRVLIIDNYVIPMYYMKFLWRYI